MIINYKNNAIIKINLFKIGELTNKLGEYY